MQTKNIWYSKNVDVSTPDFVHQTLMHETLEEIKELQEKIGQEKVRELFVRHPKKIYTNAAFNFIKNFILHISLPIDEQKYLKHTSRYIGR